MARLAIFGDSIPWGSWDPDGGGWATRLKRDYMRRSAPDLVPADYVSVHLFAVPGHRVADVAGRIVADLAMLAPDAVVLAMGINDSPEPDADVTDPAEFDRDYRFVLDQACLATPRVFALSTTGVDPVVRPGQAARLPAHNARIAALCGSVDVPVIEVFSVLTSVDLVPDGLHPNAAGHDKLHRVVAAALDATGFGKPEAPIDRG